MIELWHEWNSVHSFKVRIVLAEKGLAWVDRTVELLKFDNLRPEYLRINPAGVVPTLVHDGECFYDSSVICEYLDEVFPDPPLKPADARARAAMRRWPKYHDEVVHPALRDASFQLLYKPFLARMPAEELAERLRHHPRPERRAKFLVGARAAVDWAVLATAVSACAGIAARIDQALIERSWLASETFTLADVAMAPFAERIVNLGMDFLWNDLPHGRRWAARLLARKTVAQACPPPRYRLPRPSDEQVARLRVLVDPGGGR
jgi:glutathione S-transferase